MIIGHHKIQSFFSRSLEKDILSHAYLFVGPESVGKFTLAKDLAEKLVGEIGSVRADVSVIEPEGEKRKEIKIESVRELIRRMAISPIAGKYKVAIINDASRMNRSAQNSLLKILEEPPAQAVIFLIASDRSKLLRTIVSRCQVIRFNLVSDEEISDAIPSDCSEKDKMVSWSLGRPGAAKKMVENKEELEYRLETNKELERLFQLNMSERMDWAQNAVKDLNMLRGKLNLWLVVFREIILGKSKLTSQPKAMRISQKLNDIILLLDDTNANPRLILENLLIEF